MYRFGGCEVDVDARRLLRDGVPAHLEPQAFDLLVHLLEQRHRVVPKHELLDGVWGHRFVSESALTTRIKEVRRAVGDDGQRQHVVQNVRGRGYRFVAELDREEPMPSRTTGLIGRDEEFDEVRARLDRTRLVTLVGPGGVGKSTLARAVAEAGTGRYADGVHLVELASLDDPTGVLPAVALTLDAMVDHARPDAAIRAMARLDALVVLDNCEHVIDAAAAVVDGLLAPVDGRVTVLATSRVRLGVGVEEVHHVGPLRADEAAELFIARAEAARTGWDAGPVDAAAVVALVEHLDRLPLTIEMAAARLGSMTFAELDTAVREGGRLLQVSHRTPTHRHRTLGSLVEWSADLLDDELRQVFVECSVFAGAFTAAEAAQIVGASTSCGSSLAALAERSLLAVDLAGPVARYRLLETVKVVATTWLQQSGNASDTHVRHARWVAAAVAEVDRGIRGADEAGARRRLDSIVSEVRAAHRWASEHEPVLASTISGSLYLAAYWTFWTEPTTWSQALLDRYPERAAELAGACLMVAATAANRGDLDRAWALATAVHDGAPDLAMRGAALEVLSDVAIYAGRLEDCARLTDELRGVGREVGDAHLVTLSVVNASLAEIFGGDPVTALARLDRDDAEAVAPSDRAWMAYTRAEALSALGDPAAIAAFGGAIEMAVTAGNPFVRSVSQLSLATEFARVGEARAALEVSADCLLGYLRHGNFVHAVTAVRHLVEILVVVGDDRAAAVLGAVGVRSDLRPSYGPESARLDDVLAGVTLRVGAEQHGRWAAEADGLEVDQAVALAVEFVAGHLGPRADDPQTILRQSTSGDGIAEV
ncbi:MAG: winged helix-turn-helix domain-containing protein [Actinobacteria bacterium]|nr:winged helix-turn-helix domain-containing protein [Actinomycetota bacterium]